MNPENEGKAGLDLSVVIPAYNEEQAISGVVSKVHQVLSDQDLAYEVIVVDDGSEDHTGEMAREAGARVLNHAYNIGNGAAVKTGIRAAQGAILVLMDGDGQHDPGEIRTLLDKMEKYDLVIGARTPDSETDFHRDFGNQIYNLFASYICNRRIEDLTSGFRVVRAEIAREFLPLLPNTFSYPTTMTLAAARSGYQYTFHPIKVKRRKGKSKISLIEDGTRFFLIIFKISTIFTPLKVFIPASFGLFFLGLGYGLYKVLFLGTRYGPTSAMLMTISGVVFLIGLVSEQISQLRFEKMMGAPKSNSND